MLGWGPSQEVEMVGHGTYGQYFYTQFFCRD